MRRSRLTPEEKEKIAVLREDGWTIEAIAKGLGASIGAIQYQCLKMGIEPPRPCKSQEGIRGPAVVRRGNHIVRHFTADEDARLLSMESDGFSRAQIARELRRPHNSIVGRLMTLARRDERRDRRAAE